MLGRKSPAPHCQYLATLLAGHSAPQKEVEANRVCLTTQLMHDILHLGGKDANSKENGATTKERTENDRTHHCAFHRG
jgi:hypothetical protein